MDDPVPDPLRLTTDGSSCVAQGRPVVVHPHYVALVLRDGDDDVVIGRVRAEFDLSEVPAEFHLMVLSSLRSGGQTWMVGAVATRHDYPVLDRWPRRRPEAARPAAAPASRTPWWRAFFPWGLR